MPQQIDPNTGRPVGIGGGDGMAGDPYVGTPDTIPGLPGLTAARRVSGANDLKPFEYLRNQNGVFYAQNALTNPNEGQPAPPVTEPPAATGSYQSATGQAFPQQGATAQPGQQQGGGVPPQFLQMLRMLSGGIGWGGQSPYGGAGYGQANSVPNAYGGGMGGGIGYPRGPSMGGWGAPQRPAPSAFFQAPDRLSRPMGIGNPNPYTTTLSGGINRGGYAFRRGGRV